MEPTQIVMVRLPVSGGLFSWGSGYLVAPGVILTAAHVVCASDEGTAHAGTAVQVCEWASQRWQDGTVTWVGADDVALIRAQACGSAARPPRWGRLAGTGAFSWTAVGYPHASVKDHQRQPEQAWGRMSALTGASAGRLALQVTSRNAREEQVGQSGWVGMSGAAVFSGDDLDHPDYLVGVVTSDERAYAGSLGALRAETFITDPGVVSLLGATATLETTQADLLDANVRAVAVDLPPGISRFEGRGKDLAALDTGGPLQILAGMGGIGKTTLAARWARDHCEVIRDVDIAWWFSAADRTALIAAMAARYRQVTARAESAEAEADARQLVTWLSNSPYRWLVVFDNAAGPKTLDGLVPRAAAGHVVVTSRFTEWSSLTPVVHRVDVLPETAAIALLAAAAGQPPGTDCEDLARALGCLPLALVQAGAYLRNKDTTFTRYRKLLAQSTDRILSADQTGAGQTVAAVLHTSLDQVVAAHGELASDVLGVLAWFAPAAIPRDILDSPAIDDQPMLAAGDPLSVDDALGGLTAYSLLTFTEDGLRVHPLVAEFVRAHLGPDAAQHVAVAVSLLDQMLATSPQLPPMARTALTDRLLPHVLEASQHAIELDANPRRTSSMLTEAASNRTDIGQFGAARALLSRARVAAGHLGAAALLPITVADGRLLKLAGWPEEAVTLLSAAVQGADQLDEDDPVNLALRYEWADSMRLSNLTGYAGPQLLELVRDQERLFGTADRRTLVTRHALGFMAANDSAESAVSALGQLLTDEEQALGADDQETLLTRKDLAYWLYKAGRLHDAIEQSEALVTDCQRVLGVEHAETLDARANLANYRGEEHSYPAAISELRDILTIRDRVLGTDDPETLAAHEDLAYWLEKSGDPKAAISELTGVVAGRERVLGPEDRHTVRSRNALGRLLKQAGEPASSPGVGADSRGGVPAHRLCENTQSATESPPT